MARQGVERVVGAAREYREEGMGFLVEKDAVLDDASIAQQRDQLGPDGVVPTRVLGFLTRMQPHPECHRLGRHVLRSYRLHRYRLPATCVGTRNPEPGTRRAWYPVRLKLRISGTTATSCVPFPYPRSPIPDPRSAIRDPRSAIPIRDPRSAPNLRHNIGTARFASWIGNPQGSRSMVR